MRVHRFVARLALMLAVSLPAMPSTGADDAFKSFKQLDSTAKMPKLKAFSPDFGATLKPPVAKNIIFEAKLTGDGEPVQQGLSWRVFSPIPADDGKLPLVASSEGGSADFQLSPGDYFVNVSFGRAGATKKLAVPESGDVDKQVLVLDAGGMLLNALSGDDTRIPTADLKFSVYSSETQEDGERGLVVANVKPNTIVRLNTGTYHVVSEYGSVNAVVRADLKVEAGKLTEATIQHRASQISFKLVSEAGGEAIADTAWSILTASGDVVAESVSAFPVMVLAEGGYTAIARNKDKIYQKDFTVEAGHNIDVELILN